MKTSVQILSTWAKIAADTCNLGAVEGRGRARWGLLASSPALGLLGDCLRGIRQGVITPYLLCSHSEGPAYTLMNTHTHPENKRKEGGEKARKINGGMQGAEVMAQWLEALAAFQEDLGSVSNTHMAACDRNSSSMGI